VLKKNLWANFQRIIELTQKIVTKLSKIWVWDSGFGIRDPEKTYSGPGSRHQKGTGSRIRIRNTAGWPKKILNFSHIICFGSCYEVQSYKPKFGHFIGLKKTEKA
jgi:hypothetical protein